jgi:hypothetical protein
MSRAWALLGMIGAIVLAGCGNLAGISPAAQPANAVTRSQEQGGRFVTLAGPRLQHAEPFLGVADTNFYLLRSMIDTRTGEIAHQLYVEDSYFGDARDWNAAHDSGGQTLRLIPITKNEISCEPGCSYAEEFAAALPEGLLRANPQGLSVTFIAKSGAEKTIAVPGELIQKQLAAVDGARAALPSAAVTPSSSAGTPAAPAPSAAPRAPPPAALPITPAG